MEISRYLSLNPYNSIHRMSLQLIHQLAYMSSQTGINVPPKEHPETILQNLIQ